MSKADTSRLCRVCGAARARARLAVKARMVLDECMLADVICVYSERDSQRLNSLTVVPIGLLYVDCKAPSDTVSGR